MLNRCSEIDDVSVAPGSGSSVGRKRSASVCCATEASLRFSHHPGITSLTLATVGRDFMTESRFPAIVASRSGNQLLRGREVT